MFSKNVIFAAKSMWKDLNRLQPQKKMLKIRYSIPPFFCIVTGSVICLVFAESEIIFSNRLNFLKTG